MLGGGRAEEKGITEDEMDGITDPMDMTLSKTPGVGVGQEGLALLQSMGLQIVGQPSE